MFEESKDQFEKPNRVSAFLMKTFFSAISGIFHRNFQKSSEENRPGSFGPYAGVLADILDEIADDGTTKMDDEAFQQMLDERDTYDGGPVRYRQQE
jgi:hypothetical protein